MPSLRPLVALVALAPLGVAHAQAPRPDPVFAHQFEDGVAALAPNLAYVPLGASNATTGPTPLTLTLTGPIAADTFVPIASSDPMRVSVVDNGVTVMAGQASAQVRVNGLQSAGTPVVLSATAGNTVAAGVRVEQALNETDLPAEADYCNIQFPQAITTTTGVTTETIFGQLFEAGVTEAPGPPAGRLAQIGYGPFGTDPRSLTGWFYFDATYNIQSGNNDEFQATFIGPAAGTYAYGFRFSGDGGGSWTYCDIDGAGSNSGQTFETGQLGTMSVNP